MMRSPTRKGSIDPTKDKYAYFKDNVQDPHDQEEDFDPNMYYYHRPEKDISLLCTHVLVLCLCYICIWERRKMTQMQLTPHRY